ncbi:NIPSNAP family protein [Peterkaempfera griseoplana]|uniref:NIPSNAP family protein n=1 Tax=Peterkaempfera griseoplana TaxID=66896 RepID=UPI0006E17A59|nr:NIPSNAP family protein [Peterkaempfera griseoplana]
MSQYQLRVYTLRTPEALAAYETIWSQHIPGLAKHRIATHGVWRAPDNEAPQLYALVSYTDADEVQEREQAYLSSPEFQADMEGFDIGQITNVAGTVLIPTADSPLR